MSKDVLGAQAALTLALLLVSSSCVFDSNADQHEGKVWQCVGESQCVKVPGVPYVGGPVSMPAPIASAPPVSAAGSGAAGRAASSAGRGAVAMTPTRPMTNETMTMAMTMTNGVSTTPAAAGSGSGPAAGGGATAAAGSGAAGPIVTDLDCMKESCEKLPDVPADAAAMGFKIVNCCASNGECGTSLNDGACTYTPDSDPQCPKIEVMGFKVPACCTADMKCGIDGSSFGMPCSSFEDAMAMSMGFLTLPPPQACAVPTPAAAK